MSLAQANQNGMMVDMAGSLLFKNIGDFHFKLVVALYAMFLFHGISHSFVTDNDTMNPNTTETSPLQTVNRKDPVENLTHEVQILTRNDSDFGNHSKGILNSTGLVTDNDTMNPNTTETSPLQTVNRKDPVENLTHEVQILTRNDSDFGNHSKGILNSTGLSFNSTQLSVDMEYTESTSAKVAENLVSTDRENSITEIPSMTIETGLDKRYDFPLKLVFKTLIVHVLLSF